MKIEIPELFRILLGFKNLKWKNTASFIGKSNILTNFEYVGHMVKIIIK